MVVGPRGPHRAADRDEAVLRLPERLRRRAQHERLPGLPRAARLPAGAQPPGRRARHGDRPRARLRDPAVVVPPEELLLPGHAEGLPDQPVRRADQRERLARAARRLASSASSARTSRRTRARPRTSERPAASTAPTTRSSTTTAPASRSSRSSRRPTSPRAAQARAYAAELRGILVATGASDGRMEEGSMRVDANVSVRRTGGQALGTRCEIKNLNSLRSLQRAVEHEAPAPVRACSTAAARRPGDAPLGRGGGTHGRRCAPRRRPTTTGTSPSPTSSPLAPDDAWRERVAAGLARCCPRAARRSSRCSATLSRRPARPGRRPSSSSASTAT